MPGADLAQWPKQLLLRGTANKTQGKHTVVPPSQPLRYIRYVAYVFVVLLYSRDDCYVEQIKLRTGIYGLQHWNICTRIMAILGVSQSHPRG